MSGGHLSIEVGNGTGFLRANSDASLAIEISCHLNNGEQHITESSHVYNCGPKGGSFKTPRDICFGLTPAETASKGCRISVVVIDVTNKKAVAHTDFVLDLCNEIVGDYNKQEWESHYLQLQPEGSVHIRTRFQPQEKIRQPVPPVPQPPAPQKPVPQKPVSVPQKPGSVPQKPAPPKPILVPQKPVPQVPVHKIPDSHRSSSPPSSSSPSSSRGPKLCEISIGSINNLKLSKYCQEHKLYLKCRCIRYAGGVVDAKRSPSALNCQWGTWTEKYYVGNEIEFEIWDAEMEKSIGRHSFPQLNNKILKADQPQLVSLILPLTGQKSSTCTLSVFFQPVKDIMK